MKVPWFFRGTRVVAFQEFLTNLKSVRFLIMASLLSLIVVGGTFGIGALAAGGPQVPSVVAWGHPSNPGNTSNVAVVWVSNAFGEPRPDASVSFYEFVAPDAMAFIGSATTDGEGFASLDVGNRSFVQASVVVGTTTSSATIVFSPVPSAFSLQWSLFDLDDDDAIDDLIVHVVDAEGLPLAVPLFVDGSPAGTTNARGYARLELPEGDVTVRIDHAGESQAFFVTVRPPQDQGLSSDAIVLFMAVGFVYLVVPIFSIVVSFDAVSKERVNGTLDLLLSRPVTRTGVFLGKFFGSFAAVALPVTVVNLVGIGVVAAVNGGAPDAGFAAAFLGLTLLLITFYVLIQMTFSSIARTSGTAVLFGVLVWLLFNILYNVVVFVLGAVLNPGNLAGQLAFQEVAGLGNPSAIYQYLVLAAFPGTIGFFGGTTLSAPVLGAAAVVWFVLLLVIGLLVFHRKVSD